MRIKSGVWYWLAVASGAVGMLYALGFAGSIEALGVISDTDFITAMVLLLLALFFARLGDHAAEREVQRRRYIDRRHARPEAMQPITTLSTAVFPSHAGAIGCRMSRALCWSEPHDE